MTSNIVALPMHGRQRVLVAHQNESVRHALRWLIEAKDVLVVEVAEGEAALDALGRGSFDLLVLELDLPAKDGLTVMQCHRVLLAHERVAVDPPAVVLTLAPEVRGNATLIGHLHSLGVTACIDDAPRAEVAALVASILRARSARQATVVDAA